MTNSDARTSITPKKERSVVSSLALAKAIHVLAVVLWIGGVAFVTFVLLPAIRKFDDVKEQYSFFEKVEHRFALQAKVTTLITGFSGFYMVIKFDLWSRFLHIEYWWMHGMVFVWFLFTIVLFILEPVFLHQYFRAQAKVNPQLLMKRVQVLHIFLITISLIVTFGATLGAH